MRRTKLVFASLCLGLLCLGAADVSSADGLKTHTNSIGMEFVLIPAGSFMMGTDFSVKNVIKNEMPQHQVTISKSFYLGKYEVTQAQWEAVMGSNPSLHKGPGNPVDTVSWDDAQAFIQRLNAKEGHKRYRLPTEAEWEYAARAGTPHSAWFFGNDENELSKYAWYYGNADKTARRSHPVGQKPDNPWGLYDVHGNVWEWVQDWYDAEYYADSPGTDPNGPSSGSYRVLRGGNWYSIAEHCRSGFRFKSPPNGRGDLLGFHLALSPE